MREPWDVERCVARPNDVFRCGEAHRQLVTPHKLTCRPERYDLVKRALHISADSRTSSALQTAGTELVHGMNGHHYGTRDPNRTLGRSNSSHVNSECGRQKHTSSYRSGGLRLLRCHSSRQSWIRG